MAGSCRILVLQYSVESILASQGVTVLSTPHELVVDQLKPLASKDALKDAMWISF